MHRLATVARELYGLVVDDGVLALAAIVWTGAVFLMSRLGFPASWGGVALVAGLAVILVESALRRNAALGVLGCGTGSSMRTLAVGCYGLSARRTTSSFTVRHCEKCNDEATQLVIQDGTGLLRCARNDGRQGASQAVFARYLNVTTGLVSQWERGEKHPQGASLKLLSLVARGGLTTVA